MTTMRTLESGVSGGAIWNGGEKQSLQHPYTSPRFLR